MERIEVWLIDAEQREEIQQWIKKVGLEENQIFLPKINFDLGGRYAIRLDDELHMLFTLTFSKDYLRRSITISANALGKPTRDNP